MEPLPIYVDLSGVAEELSLSAERMDALSSFVLDRLVQRYSEEWTNLVNRELRSTRRDYLQAMSFDRVSSTEAVFTLNYSKGNPVPIMLEVGHEPFDEKVGFSQSPKRKMKKGGGWYVTVPFRFATSETLAESGAFSGILPRIIQNMAKKSGSPLRQSDLPSPHSSFNQRAIIDRMNKKVDEYKHKVSIYAGLVRKDISSTNQEKRGGYFTFRRVSDKSDPLSWWNKGFEKHDFMGRAITSMNIQATVNMAIDNFFES